jgi:hypothetical protein
MIHLAKEGDPYVQKHKCEDIPAFPDEEKSRVPQHLEGSRYRMKAARCYCRPDFSCFGKKQAKSAARIVVV